MSREQDIRDEYEHNLTDQGQLEHIIASLQTEFALIYMHRNMLQLLVDQNSSVSDVVGRAFMHLIEDKAMDEAEDTVEHYEMLEEADRAVQLEPDRV